MSLDEQMKSLAADPVWFVWLQVMVYGFSCRRRHNASAVSPIARVSLRSQATSRHRSCVSSSPRSLIEHLIRLACVQEISVNERRSRGGKLWLFSKDERGVIKSEWAGFVLCVSVVQVYFRWRFVLSAHTCQAWSRCSFLFFLRWFPWLPEGLLCFWFIHLMRASVCVCVCVCIMQTRLVFLCNFSLFCLSNPNSV